MTTLALAYTPPEEALRDDVLMAHLEHGCHCGRKLGLHRCGPGYWSVSGGIPTFGGWFRACQARCCLSCQFYEDVWLGQCWGCWLGVVAPGRALQFVCSLSHLCRGGFGDAGWHYGRTTWLVVGLTVRPTHRLRAMDRETPSGLGFGLLCWLSFAGLVTLGITMAVFHTLGACDLGWVTTACHLRRHPGCLPHPGWWCSVAGLSANLTFGGWEWLIWDAHTT